MFGDSILDAHTLHTITQLHWTTPSISKYMMYKFSKNQGLLDNITWNLTKNGKIVVLARYANARCSRWIARFTIRICDPIKD
jgi:hypothetical protein